MGAKTYLRYACISPRKAWIVCDLTCDENMTRTNATLIDTPKTVPELLLKPLKSAASNTENNHQMDPERLYVSQAFICPDPIIKRMIPRAQSHAYRINKRISRITITVAGC